MKNYFVEIGFQKEVPEIILDCAIYAWSKFDISIRRDINPDYAIISSVSDNKHIEFELLTGIELYSVRYDGDLEIRYGGKKLSHNSMIRSDVAMYIFKEMMDRVHDYRKIAGIERLYGESKFYGKIPVFLVGWLADLVCWKDKSYTLSEANIGEAFKSITKDTTVVMKFSIDGTRYRLFYDVDNDYEDITLRVNRVKVNIIDVELANFIVIKLADCFRTMAENAESNGIVCNI